MNKKVSIIMLLAIMVFSACHRKNAPNKSTNTNAITETGFASYYADKFDGKPTSSGEKYSSVKFTAAHRTIAFGTLITVTNLSNGKSVIVKINDRGPFVNSRIIDLSKVAAKQIDMVQAGIVKVSLHY